MPKFLILTLSVLLFAACTPTSTTVVSSPSPSLDVPAESTATLVLIGHTPTSNAQPTQVLEVTPGPNAGIGLQVLSPLDEAIVNTPQVDVIGFAPAGAVVTVNDEIIVVGDDGQFKTTVSLEEGPNVIEIVGSDIDGNEASLMLSVTYEP